MAPTGAFLAAVFFAGDFLAADFLVGMTRPSTMTGLSATIGRNSAIAEIKFLPRLKGFPAWIIWVALHIATLLGNRNRLATFVNLVTKYLAPSRRTNPIVGDVPVFDRVAVKKAVK